MAPFRWPDTKHDIALAIEVAVIKPSKHHNWEVIARKLSNIFSTEGRQVELSGRGCRERMDRLLEKFRTEDARSLKRSGTEEEYGELNKLLEDISCYRRDVVEMKANEKEIKKKKEVDEKKQAATMRTAAMESLGKRKNSGTGSSSSEEDQSTNDDESSTSSKKGCKRHTKKRFSRMSAIEMLNEKNSKKAVLKEKELSVRQLELEFQQKKFEAEGEERRQRLEIELEERKTMVELLKKKL